MGMRILTAFTEKINLILLSTKKRKKTSLSSYLLKISNKPTGYFSEFLKLSVPFSALA